MNAALRQPARACIWIDLDNTPHVPFFGPIIRELGRRHHAVTCTARDAFQVCELAEKKGLPVSRVGRHHGRNRLAKVCGLFYRALQLMPTACRAHPALAVSHGSRSQFIIANRLGIPTVLLEDYEFSLYPAFMRPRWEIMPNVIPPARAVCSPRRLRTYPGLKEDVYVPGFRPEPSIMEELGLRAEDIVATVRPPATEAHYHDARSETLFVQLMARLLQHPAVRVALLPRNQRQAEEMKDRHPEWFSTPQVRVPAGAVDGLNLLWHSDLVVSGGGTMIREAAALGVPAYSLFSGRLGAVDQHLQAAGRLVLIQTADDVQQKIVLTRRPRHPAPTGAARPTLSVIVQHIEEILGQETRRTPQPI
jgi:hypothetical protein